MTPSRRMSSLRAMTALGASLLGLIGSTPLHATSQYAVTNLVSDGAVPAVTIDPNLVNPWGIASSPTSPMWISDNGTGVSTIYTGAGAKIPLTVMIPPPAGGTPPAAPTGIVFNGTGDFSVSNPHNSGSPLFIFATEDGTISGWSPAVNPTSAILAVDNSDMGSIFKGLAIGSSGGSNFLYATDFANGVVDQFDSNYDLVRSFTDPSVASGYSPFGIRTIGDLLYVTYALKSGEDDVAGPGNGYVDVFNLDGTFVRQLVGLGGQINSPWGLDIAPAGFGEFGGDLLVGNFGDGTISAFDPTTGSFLGQLLGTDGDPLVLDGLWGLINGNGGNGGDPSKVYFTAGLNDESDGLFGSIASVPEPSTWAMMLFGFGAVGLSIRRRRASSAIPQAA